MEGLRTRKPYTYKRWCEFGCDAKGENYAVAICTDRKAKSEGELAGREVLKRLKLTFEEFEALKEGMCGYKAAETKYNLLAVEKFAPEKLGEKLEAVERGEGWRLNDCVETICWVPVKSNAKNAVQCYRRKYSPSKMETELLNADWKRFAKKHPFKVSQGEAAADAKGVEFQLLKEDEVVKSDWDEEFEETHVKSLTRKRIDVDKELLLCKLHAIDSFLREGDLATTKRRLRDIFNWIRANPLKKDERVFVFPNDKNPKDFSERPRKPGDPL